MKYIYQIFLIILISPFSVVAEWGDPVSHNEKGVFFIDFSKMKKSNGYNYIYILQNNNKPDEYGDLSSISYYEIDCSINRFRSLSLVFYSEKYGKGKRTDWKKRDFVDWTYPSPGDTSETILEKTCKHEE